MDQINSSPHPSKQRASQNKGVILKIITTAKKTKAASNLNPIAYRIWAANSKKYGVGWNETGPTFCICNCICICTRTRTTPSALLTLKSAWWGKQWLLRPLMLCDADSG